MNIGVTIILHDGDVVFICYIDHFQSATLWHIKTSRVLIGADGVDELGPFILFI